MKLNFTLPEIVFCVEGQLLGQVAEESIKSVAFDTRKIIDGKNQLFFALLGDFRNGHSYIGDAYSKGVRFFVISEEMRYSDYPEASFIHVDQTLLALQKLAKAHRSKFSYPIVAITGSVGKTMVKEWAYHFLSANLRVIRSPKSYNSQLGVALSLLELHENCDIALIEVGISKPGEMDALRAMIKPDIGVFTSFGSAHRENFPSAELHLAEKLKLFIHCQKTLVAETIQLSSSELQQIKGEILSTKKLHTFLETMPFQDKVSLHNLSFAIQLAIDFGVPDEMLSLKIASLPRLALRMETFEGIDGNTVINDTYNLDFDALTLSLEYQLSVAENRERVVIIGLNQVSEEQREALGKMIDPFRPNRVFYLTTETVLEPIENSVILIKGSRKSDMQRIARQFRLKNHKTYLEIDLPAIRHNLSVFKAYLKPETKLLVMVKSNAYGCGIEKMAAFFEQQGIDYLGVAYADEGVELRKQNIDLPILVMNAEEDGFEDCIHFDLEPAIFSFEQLDQFIKELIFSGKQNYPIHIKINTGMARLGFELSELSKVCEVLQAQPEVKVKSIYSHLADSDNLLDTSFTNLQIQHFELAAEVLQERLSYSFDRHLLNSEAVARFPESQFEMVRLGIGIYGFSTNPAFKAKLEAAVSWQSSISQVRTIQRGEGIGYGRSFIAEKEMKIATIPVGYADGFRRSLGNGKAVVYIQGYPCKVVGKVCMDMLMVDTSQINAQPGDAVEIFGKHQSMEQFAAAMDTIPYEVLTSISKRVHRIYLV